MRLVLFVVLCVAVVSSMPDVPLEQFSPEAWLNSYHPFHGLIPSPLDQLDPHHDDHALEEHLLNPEGLVPEDDHHGHGDVEALVNESDDIEPVYEYYSTELQDHMYTTDKSVIEGDAHITGGPVLEAHSWIYKGITFFTSKKQKPGMVQLLVYFNQALGDHALTVDAKKYGPHSNYRPFAKLGWVYAEDPHEKNVQPVYEFYDDEAGDHAYSMSENLDMDSSQAESLSYKFEGKVFYAFAGPFVPMGHDDASHGHHHHIEGDDPIPVPDPDVPTGQRPDFDWSTALHQLRGQTPSPILRYQAKFSTDSLLTTNFETLGKGAAAWSLDGVVGSGYVADEEGTVPLHRYYNKKTDSHFYTIEGREVTSQYGWTYLGAEAFVYADKPAGVATVGLRRFFNKLNGGFWFSPEGEDSSAKEAQGFELERVICYILVGGEIPSEEQPTAAAADAEKKDVSALLYSNDGSQTFDQYKAFHDRETYLNHPHHHAHYVNPGGHH